MEEIPVSINYCRRYYSLELSSAGQVPISSEYVMQLNDTVYYTLLQDITSTNGVYLELDLINITLPVDIESVLNVNEVRWKYAVSASVG